jgi:hypothetical protein
MALNFYPSQIKIGDGVITCNRSMLALHGCSLSLITMRSGPRPSPLIMLAAPAHDALRTKPQRHLPAALTICPARLSHSIMFPIHSPDQILVGDAFREDRDVGADGYPDRPRSTAVHHQEPALDAGRPYPTPSSVLDPPPTVRQRRIFPFDPDPTKPS